MCVCVRLDQIFFSANTGVCCTQGDPCIDANKKKELLFSLQFQVRTKLYYFGDSFLTLTLLHSEKGKENIKQGGGDTMKNSMKI